MPLAPPALLTSLAVLLALGLATARAQTPDLDAARLQVLEQQVQQAQTRALDAQREADTALARLQTEQTLRGMASDRAASSPGAALLAASPPLPPQPPSAVTSIDSQLVADSERIMQLQRDALARSNARILAVRPAL